MTFDFQLLLDVWPTLLSGLKLNFLLTLLATAGGILLGVVLALMRLSKSRILRVVGTIYVDFFRAMPLILVIFWFYFLAPVVLGRPVGGFFSVLIAFTMFEAAYFCEIIRGGIMGIPNGQMQAAMSTGLTRWQSMRFVILPQVFRNMLPVLMTQTIILFQDTSLVYIVGLYDFVTTSSIIASREARLVEIYVFVAIVFFIICSFASWAVQRLTVGKEHRT